MLRNTLLLSTLLILASCSMGSSDNSDKQRSVASSSASQDVSLVINSDDEIVVLDTDLQNEIASVQGNEVIVEEDNIFHNADDFKEINRSIASATNSIYQIEYETYEVVKGDTLMLISFKVYGDVSKWRTISILNEDQLVNDNIEVGMKLRYEKPDDEFVWKPMGTPYMVKEDDSLSIISATVYNSTKHWQYIWDNNRPLVKNPNLIFAGFTLYYLPIEEKKHYQKVLEARYKRMEEALKVTKIKEKSKSKLNLVKLDTSKKTL
ncbi:LysM peptidoglycan-binding domain-containing protein [Halobacteriovorax sp. HLS]|uniref:LysM peptidoglycan-binding domain-containing protein n=1 Tax=Halobacteriovorax sp. HLS TaxID=2234000 RepID=UPI000FD7F20A|nr:LysM peptidoglycan-binding domain-containing protein [Halobacteriovorax sp. HLS]